MMIMKKKKNNDNKKSLKPNYVIGVIYIIRWKIKLGWFNIS